MLAKLVDAMFGCHHANYSFPITVRTGSRRNKAASLTGTYVVCLECGREFPYDWTQMKVVSTREGERRVAALAAKEAA